MVRRSIWATPAGPGQERGDRDQPAAGPQVEHGAAGHRLGMVEHVPGQRLTARPGGRPERRIGSGVDPAGLQRLPQRDDVVGHGEGDLRDEEGPRRSRVGPDDVDHRGAGRPARRAISFQ